MIKVVVTGEHAGNHVPDDFKYIFPGQEEVLQTHRGIDIGSKYLFEKFQKIADYSKVNEITRLLIELNRSPYHPKLFSEFSNTLPSDSKDYLKKSIYESYRNEVENRINQYINNKHSVIHLSVHTFTPVLNNKERTADIGLLFDPSRSDESRFCRDWQKALKMAGKEYKTRLNYPYLGKSDGFVTFLRKKFPDNYLGIELEVNQKHVSQMRKMADLLVSTFNDILKGPP